MMELVSAVGGGTLGAPIDLNTLAEDLPLPIVQYDPMSYHGIIARYEEDGPAILIYKSGSYSVSGAESVDELRRTFSRLDDTLRPILSNEINYEPSFEVRNLVYSGRYGDPESPSQINLEAACVGFGLDKTEYEPEQFPGVFYRPPDLPGVFLIFATGSVMLTGVSDPEVAAESFSEVISRLDEMFRQTAA